MRDVRDDEVLQARMRQTDMLQLQPRELQWIKEHQESTGDTEMTTLNDIDILRKVYEHSLEAYSRTCRRVTALVLAGRDLTDERHHRMRDYVEFRRDCVTHTRRDLENAIEVQAMAASV